MRLDQARDFIEVQKQGLSAPQRPVCVEHDPDNRTVWCYPHCGLCVLTTIGNMIAEDPPPEVENCPLCGAGKMVRTDEAKMTECSNCRAQHHEDWAEGEVMEPLFPDPRDADAERARRLGHRA